MLKSTNGGASWRRTGLGAVSQLLFDPRDPGTLYAAAVGGVIPYWDAMEKVSDGAGRGRGGVFKSSDQGESWDPVGLQGTTVHALALDPEHPGTMYAGNGFQGHPQDDGRRRELARRGPQRSDDHRADAGSEQHRHPLRNDVDVGGRRLQERGRGPQPQLANHHAGTPPVGTGHEFSTALALDPRNPATIYVATKRRPSPPGRGLVSRRASTAAAAGDRRTRV